MTMALGLPEDITFLKAVESYQDDEGGFHEGERVPRHALCSPVTLGSLTRAELRSSEIRTQNSTESPYIGSRIVAVVEVWSVDYEDEDQAIFHDEEVQVEDWLSIGARKQLILRQRIGNVTEE